MPRLNILISAFAFEPSESSEPGVAWRFANIAARQHRVWVLTSDIPGPVRRTRSYLESHPDLAITLVPFRPFPIPKSIGWRFINIHYWLWQRQIISVAKKLHEEVGFDVVHHLTFSRYWIPTSLVKLPVPFVWGPVGSGDSTPVAFVCDLPWKARLENFTREQTRRLFQMDPLLRKTARHACVSFGINREATTQIVHLGASTATQLPQVCFSEERINELASLPKPPPLPPLRLLSIGRSLYWKGFHLGIRTVAELRRRNLPISCRIVGEGPFLPYLKALAASLDVGDAVHFPGKIPDILPELQQAHILLHPALHESFGNVCLEALAAGRPVICLNTGGPASQVTPECGWAVGISDFNEAIREMADACESILKNPSKLDDMSEAAKLRASSAFHISILESAVLNAYEHASKS